MSEMDAIKDLIRRAWKTGKDRGMSEDEIKSIIEQTLLENETKKEETEIMEFTVPQTLYGPPEMMKEEVVVQEYVVPQALYGPPAKEEVEVHEYRGPQVLYGPPPREEIQTMFVDAQESTQKPDSKKI